MAHAQDPDQLLEVLGDELRAIIRDNPGVCIGVLLLCPLNDDAHIDLDHLLLDIPVHKEAAISVQKADQVKERAHDVQIRDIDMPMLMRA